MLNNILTGIYFTLLYTNELFSFTNTSASIGIIGKKINVFFLRIKINI